MRLTNEPPKSNNYSMIFNGWTWGKNYRKHQEAMVFTCFHHTNVSGEIFASTNCGKYWVWVKIGYLKNWMVWLVRINIPIRGSWGFSFSHQMFDGIYLILTRSPIYRPPFGDWYIYIIHIMYIYMYTDTLSANINICTWIHI